LPLADDALRSGAARASKARTDYSLPRREVQEFYLGRDSASKVTWLTGTDGPSSETALEDSDAGCLDFFQKYLQQLCLSLESTALDNFGFLPDGISPSMIRIPFAAEDEQVALSPAALDADSVEDGVVAEYLDFIQTRRLCMMCFVDGEGGSIQLHPRKDQSWSWETVHMPVEENRLLIFRNDVMSYTYKPSSANDLVIQAWFLEIPDAPEIVRVDGEVGLLEHILGNGPPQHALGVEQVHVMSGSCRLPGGGYTLAGARTAWTANTDGPIDIPAVRWDHLAYFDPEAPPGKTRVRHTSLIGSHEIMSFDNKFFGMTEVQADLLAPDHRIIIEASFEALHAGGFVSLAALQGTRMAIGVGDCGTDFDQFRGLCGQNPDEWAQCRCSHGISKTNRLAHIFGLTGQQYQIDTACSSTLVTHNMLHALLRQHRERDTRMALTFGSQTLTSPWGIIGLAAAGMLGPTGRCKFADHSADGFVRGEGTGGLLLMVSDELEAVQKRLGAVLGSFINQDGRSASMTAPNGPSQQLCERGSFIDGHVTIEDHMIHENHGTGTAIGDPIETGSARNIFRRRSVGTPLVISSAKSHTGHLECTAGSVSAIKLLMTLYHSSINPNCHLRVYNQHLDLDGFPGMFQDELMDLGGDGLVSGCNSFGFGGTNSHTDYWASCLVGPRQNRIIKNEQYDYVSVACPQCHGPMCHRCKVSIPEGGFQGKHKCATIREEFASYDICSDCYDGSYTYAEPSAIQEGIDAYDRGYSCFMIGTWSTWSAYDEMAYVPEEGAYVGEVTLGDMRVEQFQLAIDQDPSMMLFPIVGKANQQARILGPSKDVEGRNWVIDGRQDGVPAGTVYKVRFQWRGHRRSITWEAVRKPLPRLLRPPSAHGALVDGQADVERGYCVAASWNEWSELLEMEWQALEDVGHAGVRGVYRCCFTIGWAGREEFQITVDYDWDKSLHPVEANTAPGKGRVCGPDGEGYGLNWEVTGTPGQMMEITLDLGSEGVAKSLTCQPVVGAPIDTSYQSWEDWDSTWEAAV